MNSQRRNWVFTINNPPDGLFDTLKDIPCLYIVYQLEEGASRTCHIQGYVRFANGVRGSSVKRRLHSTAHVEPRLGTHEQARAYCMKETGRLRGPVENGTPPAPGARNDLKRVVDRLKTEKISDVLDDEGPMVARYHRGLKFIRHLWQTKARGYDWREPNIRVLIGEPGSGKTSWAYRTDKYLYPVPTATNGSTWFDGYDGHETLLLDDFYGGLKYDFLLRFLDGYPLTVPVKGGFVTLNHDLVIITSNSDPLEWYQNVKNIGALKRRLTEFAFVLRFEKGQEPVHLVDWPVPLELHGVVDTTPQAASSTQVSNWSIHTSGY